MGIAISKPVAAVRLRGRVFIGAVHADALLNSIQILCSTAEEELELHLALLEDREEVEIGYIDATGDFIADGERSSLLHTDYDYVVDNTAAVV